MRIMRLHAVAACCLAPLSAADSAADVRPNAAPAHTSGSNQAVGTLANAAVLNETIRTGVATGGTLTVRHGFVLAKPTPVTAPAGNG
ncbi:MAG: hypothetical protein RLZZ127_846 [Planctomycetota bacterium]|jgi:hypothetical protein